jgi:hypothetical protein
MPRAFVTVASRRFKFGHPLKRAIVMPVNGRPNKHYRLRPRDEAADLKLSALLTRISWAEHRSC